jgi:hypothetical protein
MATFLFLVSLSATTLLLIANAAEEIASVTRRLFLRARRQHKRVLPTKAFAPLPMNATPRASAQPRPVATAPNDWVPDRAA